MASEISVEYLTGYTLYFVVENASAQRWYTVTPVFQTHAAGNWTDYDVALVEQTSSGTYVGSFPSGITAAGRYRITAYHQLGGSPAITDTKVASDDFDWDGSAECAFGIAATESYATDGATASPLQLLYMIWSAVSDMSVSGTTLTTKKLDGTTTAMTFTLNSATAPTSRARAS